MRGPAIGALTAAAASFAFAGRQDPHAYDRVTGAVLRLDGNVLMVGTLDGGVVAFDARSHGKLADCAGSVRAPVSDVVWLGGRPWWILQGSSRLQSIAPDGSPIDIDLAPLHLGGSIRRLGTWQGMLVLSGESGTRLMEPGTRQIQSLFDLFPKDIAEAAEEGDILTSWAGDGGLVVTVRHIGERPEPEQPGALTDMALINGWTVDRDGHARLLGGYTTSLVKFRQTDGPRVRLKLGIQEIDQPHAIADLGNVRIGPEGVIGLQKSGALTVPFYKDGWMPSRIDTDVAPDYAQSLAYSASTLWWSDGKRLMQASLEDGSTDVYVPLGQRGRVSAVAANDDGAFVLSESGGIAQVRPGEFTSAVGYVRYAASKAERAPRSSVESRAASVLAIAPPSALASTRSLIAYLRRHRVTLRPRPMEGVSDLQYGDLLKDRGRVAVYVGAGETLGARNGRIVRSTVDAFDDLQVSRILEPSGTLQASGSGLLGYVPPVGLGSPYARLGSDRYVTWDPESPLDKPSLPLQMELASMLDSWIGVPYRWAGNSMDGTDCSGLVTSLYRAIGIPLPRHSQHIGRAPYGEIVLDQLHFGDVLVFPSPKHCAIYVGNGTIIEAISHGVTYSPITKYRRAVVRRFIEDTSQTSHRDVRRVGSQ